MLLLLDDQEQLQQTLFNTREVASPGLAMLRSQDSLTAKNSRELRLLQDGMGFLE